MTHIKFHACIRVIRIQNLRNAIGSWSHIRNLAPSTCLNIQESLHNAAGHFLPNDPGDARQCCYGCRLSVVELFLPCTIDISCFRFTRWENTNDKCFKVTVLSISIWLVLADVLLTSETFTKLIHCSYQSFRKCTYVYTNTQLNHVESTIVRILQIFFLFI